MTYITAKIPIVLEKRGEDMYIAKIPGLFGSQISAPGRTKAEAIKELKDIVDTYLKHWEE